MAITGGIKFFKKSKSLLADGSSIVASTGTASDDYALDRNNFTVWRSVGSDDTTTETLTITFPEATTLDRIFLLNTNFKDFNIQYDNAGWTHFASVVGLDGSKANITETAFADSTAYYEFTPVTTESIRIQVLKTQTADEEKYLSQFIATEEIGTLLGYPIINPVSVSRNSRVSDMPSGRKNVVKSIETFSIGLSLESYPASYDDDLDLLLGLHDRECPFLVWLCGGKRGTTRFPYALRGFRIGDVIPVQIVTDIEQAYRSNIYSGPVEFDFELHEVTV